MIKYNLGRVMPKYRGTYDPTTVYDEMDIVVYSGSSFISLTPENNGHTPTEGDTVYWGLIAKHGEREQMSQQEIDALIATVYQSMVDSGAVFDNQYVHTTNNYSDTDKAVVDDVRTNPDKYENVQADWDEENVNADSYIKNKPQFIVDADYTHTDNNFTDALKIKLQTINENADANVQSNWNETNVNADSYIKNKPTIPTRTSQLTNNSYFVSDANYTHIDNNFTDALKNKLEQTNVLTDTMVTRINNTIPEPTENIITNSTYTISNLQSNYVYKFNAPLTSLQISASNVGYVPTMLYFSTGNSFQWQFPNNLKSTQYVDFDPNQSYMVAVMNNILTYVELIEQ